MLDVLIDMISYALRYGISWLTLGLAILALFKSRKLRKRFNRFLPPLLRDEQDSEVSKYVQNQARIESKLDALLEKEGVVWIGNTEISLNTEAKNLKRLRSIFSKVTLQRKLLLRRKNMSRKLILMIFGAIVTVLSQFGITLDPETVIGVCTLLISAILGQSAVDINGIGQYAPLKEKFKSKKLWTALGGSVLLIISDHFALGLSSEVVYWFAGLGATYILGKSAVSVAQANKNDSNQYH